MDNMPETTMTNPTPSPAPRKKRKKRKNRMSSLFIVLIILAGLGLMLYPTVSNWINERSMSRAIAGYAHAVEGMTEKNYDEMWAQADAFNRALVGNSDRFIETLEGDNTYYYTILDITGTGIMGYVEIPAIKVELPIYHGTSEAVLQVAVGHIEGTSLPVGGPSTHSAISGHRGLPSAKLFTNLDDLKVGDVFYINILNKTLTYEIDQVSTVLPQDVSLLDIVEGEDYCTLVTCTPYGVNTHRLLVRGHRVDTVVESTDTEVTPEPPAAEVINPIEAERDLPDINPIVYIGLGLVLLVLILFMKKKLFKPRKKGRREL